MNEPTLSDIRGLGTVRVQQLAERGIHNLDDLIAVDISVITAVSGINQRMARLFRTSARRLISGRDRTATAIPAEQDPTPAAEPTVEPVKKKAKKAKPEKKNKKNKPKSKKDKGKKDKAKKDKKAKDKPKDKSKKKKDKKDKSAKGKKKKK
jgi:hypothetical protein